MSFLCVTKLIHKPPRKTTYTVPSPVVRSWPTLSCVLAKVLLCQSYVWPRRGRAPGFQYFSLSVSSPAFPPFPTKNAQRVLTVRITKHLQDATSVTRLGGTERGDGSRLDTEIFAPRPDRAFGSLDQQRRHRVSPPQQASIAGS